MKLDDALTAVLTGLGTTIDLTLVVADSPGDDFARSLASFAEAMASAGEQVRLARAPGEEPLGELPGLALETAGSGRVIWSALPTGRERRPFVDTLEALCALDDASDTRPVLDEAATIVVFVTPECPICPLAVEAAARLAVRCPVVSVRVVDATVFPAVAERYNVRSVPVTLLDGLLTLDSVPTTRSLIGHLSRRATPAWERAVFRSMVVGGRHRDAAVRICHGAGPYFIDIWSTSTLAERIALMLVAEQVLEGRERCMDTLVPDLVGLLQSDDASLRGDTADLLGRIGHPDVLEPLATMLNDENAHVAELAREVLGELGPRMQSARRVIAAKAGEKC